MSGLHAVAGTGPQPGPDGMVGPVGVVLGMAVTASETQFKHLRCTEIISNGAIVLRLRQPNRAPCQCQRQVLVHNRGGSKLLNV
jgi:hypothetical protein